MLIIVTEEHIFLSKMHDFNQTFSKIIQGCYPQTFAVGAGHPSHTNIQARAFWPAPNISDAALPLVDGCICIGRWWSRR